MSAEPNLRGASFWTSTATGASLASLAAVVLFTFGLGVVFLPFEVQQKLREPCISVTHCCVSNDGHALVCVSRFLPHTHAGWNHCLSAQDTAASGRMRQICCTSLQPSSVAAGPNGRKIFVGDWDRTLYEIDLARPSAEPLAIGRHRTGCARALACSTDGRFLFSLGTRDLCAWNLVTKELQWRRDDGGANSFVIHPDSQRVIYGGNDGKLFEIDIESGLALASIAECRWAIDSIEISRDGSNLAVVEGNAVRLFHRSSGGSWQVQEVPELSISRWRLAVFSPDNRMLLTCTPYGTRLVAWDLQTGEQLFDLEGHTKAVIGAKFADANTLLSWGIDGTIRTWKMDARRAAGVVSLAALLPPG